MHSLYGTLLHRARALKGLGGSGCFGLARPQTFNVPAGSWELLGSN